MWHLLLLMGFILVALLMVVVAYESQHKSISDVEQVDDGAEDEKPDNS